MLFKKLQSGFTWLGIFLFSGQLALKAQSSYSFHSINLNSEIGNNSVTSIAQDKQGYVWVGSVGTGSSVQCFDMYDFVDSRAVNYFDRIFIDKQGRKWMCGRSGIALENGHLGDTKHIRINNDTSSYTIPFQNWIYEDSKQRIWIKVSFITGETKYYYYEEEKRKFFPYDHILPKTKRTITTIRDWGDGNFWIGTSEGLMYYNDEDKQYYYPGDRKFPLANFPRILDPTHSLYRDRKGNMIIVTWSDKPWSGSNLHLLDKNGAVLLDYPSAGDIRGCITDNSNNIWIAGDHFFRIDNKSKLIEEVILPEKYGPIIAISMDREGNIWLGTEHGILVFDPEQKFEHRENINIDGVKYRGETLALLCTHDSIIIAGTWQGDHIYFYDKDFRPLHNLDHFTKKNLAALMHVPVWSLLESSNQNIWIGGQHGNLFMIDRRNKKIEKSDEDIFKKQTIRVIHEDVQHNIWFSTQKGLIIKRNYLGSFSVIGQPSLSIAYFINDDQFLWISTGPYLLKVNPTTGLTIKKYTMKLHNPEEDVIVFFSQIIEIKQDKIILNSSEGLVEFNKASGDFNVLPFSGYHEMKTVVQNYQSIEVIGEGKYVASLSNGIIVENDKQSLNGILTKNTFMANSSLQLPDGSFVFGNESGFTVVKSTFLKPRLNSFQAPAITSITLQSKALNVDSVTQFGLTLEYDQNYFSVSCSALQFRERENIHYFYRINKSTDFINNGHGRTITYGGLSPGKHQLEIYFATSRERSPTTSFTIEVIPPFWATWWFVSLSIITTIFVFIAIYQIRISNIKKLARVREKISRDLHDEMGSNISTISILSHVVKDNLKKISGAEKEIQIIEKIGQLSSKAMDAASEIVWSVNPRNDSMEEIAKQMRLIGTQLEDFGINFSFEMMGDTKQHKLNPQTRSHFYLIYKEIITNAGKHSKSKNVWVTLRFTKEFVELAIKDDGIGFDSRYAQMGNGLRNIRSRADIINATIDIESEPGKGTISTIKLL